MDAWLIVRINPSRYSTALYNTLSIMGIRWSEKIRNEDLWPLTADQEAVRAMLSEEQGLEMGWPHN